jgi:amino acid transporter
MALGGYVLGDYLTSILFSFGPQSSAIYAALTIAALTAINIAGLRESSRTQNVMTVLLVLGMLTVGVAGLLAPAAPAAVAVAPAAAAPAAGSVPPLFGVALLFVLYTFGGWNEAAYISAEVRGGRRAIVSALVLAIVLITAVYLAFVWALLNGLGFDGLKNSQTPGVDIARAAFGPAGEKLLGAIAALAALTTVNATAIVGARSNFALGRDWPMLSFMSTWNDGRDAPVKAFLVQGGIALALVLLAAVQKSGVAAMVEFTAPVFWFFFLLTGVALFVLRFREPHAPRPFKVPLYPVVPVLFCCTCAFLLWNSLKWALEKQSVQVSLAVMATGLVAWLLARRKPAAA